MGVPVAQMRVVCPGDMPQHEVALVLSSVSIHLAAFERDFGHAVPTTITVFDTPFLVNGGWCEGFNWPSAGRDEWGIWIWKGPEDALGSGTNGDGLYHEFAHSLFGPGHTLGIWSEQIYPENDRVIREILASRLGDTR